MKYVHEYNTDMNSTTNSTEVFSLTTSGSTTIQYKKRCLVFGSQFHVTIRFPSNGFLLNHYFLFGVCLSLAVLTVFLNSATVLTFWGSPKLKNRISYFLIMLQSLFDTFVGMFNTSFFTYYIASEIAGNVQCHVVFISHLLAQAFLGLSLTSLFLINLERYFGIIHPLAHKSNCSKARILKCGVCLFLLWVIVSELTFIDKTASRYCLQTYLTIYCILTAYIYIQIYWAVIPKPFRIHNATVAVRVENSDSSRDSSSQQTTATLKDKQRHLKETKLARSCFMVVACFVMCHVPLCLVIVLNLQGFVRDAAHLWALTATFSNPVWNSLIFAWRNRILRSEMKRVLSKYFCT